MLKLYLLSMFFVCHFTSVDHFEYTPEMIIFDLVGIMLYHGWLVEPESSPFSADLATLSYNLLTEKAIAATDELPDGATEEERKEWEERVGLGKEDHVNLLAKIFLHSHRAEVLGYTLCC